MKVLKAQAPLENPHPRSLQDALAYTAKRHGYALSVLGRHFIANPWRVDCSTVQDAAAAIHESAQVIMGDLTPIKREEMPHNRMYFQFNIERAQPKGSQTLELSVIAPTPKVE